MPVFSRFSSHLCSLLEPLLSPLPTLARPPDQMPRELPGFPTSEVIELGPSERRRRSASHHGPVGSDVAPKAIFSPALNAMGSAPRSLSHPPQGLSRAASMGLLLRGPGTDGEMSNCPLTQSGRPVWGGYAVSHRKC